MTAQSPWPAKDLGAAAVVARWFPRLGAIGVTIFCGVLAVTGVLAVIGPSSKFPHLVPLPGVVAFLTLVAAAAIWGCARGWRMGVRIHGDGVTVRNYVRTYRVSWPEVSRFADGARFIPAEGELQALWALSIVLHDGRTITASGTAWAPPTKAMLAGLRDAHEARLQEMLAVFRDAAEAHGIPAELTGVPRAGRKDDSPS